MSKEHPTSRLMRGMDTLPVWITHLAYSTSGQQVALTPQFLVPGAFLPLPDKEVEMSVSLLCNAGDEFYKPGAAGGSHGEPQQ